MGHTRIMHIRQICDQQEASALLLVASITVESVRQLGLAEGSQVTAMIKASDVIVATGG